jgi:beta-aspartyl-dipeptidase (metallo-type)
MTYLLKGGDVYDPEKLGKKDILIINNQVVAIEDSLSVSELSPTVIDVGGKTVCPGFIDQHVHITGVGVSSDSLIYP